MKLRRFGFALLTLLLVGMGYLRFPAYAIPSASGSETFGAPQIKRFSASSTVLTTGEALTLSWRVSGTPPPHLQLVSEGRVQAVEGEAVQLEPTLSGRYTLVAQNRRGSHQRDQFVEVRAAAPPAAGRTPAGPVTGAGVAEAPPEDSPPGDTSTGGTSEDDSRPEGSFGVSLNPNGPFVNDAVGGVSDPDDERILRMAPGGEFFAEVSYEDPDGIASVALNLVNSSPDGLAGTLSPDRPPFSVVGAPTGTCNLGRLPTAVRCVYRVAVAEDARNISELPGAGDEFAYVFRVRVSDGLGNVANEPVRGYVAVTQP